jgi:hypothetical protein
MLVSEYREKFKLSPTTSLVSEMERQKMKEQGLRLFLSMTQKQRKEALAKARASRGKNGHKQPKESLENKNKKGTCPDQLLAKITEVKEKLGHTPSLKEFMKETGGQRFKHLIFKTFGSWKEALSMLGLEQKEQKQHGGRTQKQTDDELLKYLELYTLENGKRPTTSDCKRGLLPPYETYRNRFGSFETARQLAGVYNLID